MRAFVEQFLQSLEVRNYSRRTVSDYRYHLDLWLKFLRLEGLGEPGSIAQATIVRFQAWLFHRPTATGSPRGVLNQNTILAALKSFFRFLETEALLRPNPAAGVAYARQPKGLPRNVLTPGEAARIIDSVDVSTALGKRDRAILEVFYGTGIRKEELRALRLADLTFGEGLLRVTLGKGARDRVVPLGRMAQAALEDYLTNARLHLLGRQVGDWVFVSYRGRRIDSRTLGVLVKQRGRQACPNKCVTPHVWRHTCATHLVQNLASLRHVQDLLGHRSLATTERYLRLTITDLKAAHAKFHPREQPAPAGCQPVSPALG